MNEVVGCPKCSHFCIELAFPRVEEWLSWMDEERIGEEGGILEEVYSDVSPDLEDMTAALKCVACGQVFMLTANTLKSNKIKVVASWKPVPRSTN